MSKQNSADPGLAKEAYAEINRLLNGSSSSNPDSGEELPGQEEQEKKGEGAEEDHGGSHMEQENHRYAYSGFYLSPCLLARPSPARKAA